MHSGWLWNRPILGLETLLGLVALAVKFQGRSSLLDQKKHKANEADKDGEMCLTEAPPALVTNEKSMIWLQLPSAKRQRLLWLITQLLEQCLMVPSSPATNQPQEEAHEPGFLL